MKYIYKNSLNDNEILATIYKSNCDTTLNHIDYHPHYELYFCRNATPQKLFFNGKEYFYDKPIIALTTPYTTHSILSTTTSENHENLIPFERFIIYFNKSLFEGNPNHFLSEKLLSLTSSVIFELNERAIQTLSDVYSIIFSNEITTQESTGLVFFILNYIFQNANIVNKTKCAESSEVVINILKYIDANIANDLNADTIAAHFFISRTKLDRDFKKYVGNSFHNIVKECRLSAAINYLKQTNLSVSEISQLCGFRNEYYFYSFFKNLTGISPHKFRLYHNG